VKAYDQNGNPVGVGDEVLVRCKITQVWDVTSGENLTVEVVPPKLPPSVAEVTPRSVLQCASGLVQKAG